MTDTKEPKTLTDFIETNSKLISTLGVFAGLAVFATKVPESAKLSESDNFALKTISFLLFTLAIRTFLEIFHNFKSFPGQLYFFGELFSFLMVGFVWIYVKAYYPYLMVLLIMFVGMVVLLFALAFLQLLVKFGFRVSWFNNISQKTKDTLTPFISLALLVGFGAVVFHFAHKP
jgi:hypothetical protein